MELAANLFRHRSLIWKRTATDLRFRYTATALGPFWTILHPLALIATYSLIFGVLMPRGEDAVAPFPIILCAGLLPWLGLTEGIARASGAFTTNRAYLKKLPVPEPVYVGEAVLTASIHMAISLVLLLVATVLVGVGPHWSWLLLPLPLVALMTLVLGVGLAIGTLNAFLPDIGEIVQVVLRVAMWVVPAIMTFEFYETNGVGGIVAVLPPTASIHTVRMLLVNGEVPGVAWWIGMLVWAVVGYAVGAWVLRALRSELKDVL